MSWSIAYNTPPIVIQPGAGQVIGAGAAPSASVAVSSGALTPLTDYQARAAAAVAAGGWAADFRTDPDINNWRVNIANTWVSTATGTESSNVFRGYQGVKGYDTALVMRQLASSVTGEDGNPTTNMRTIWYRSMDPAAAHYSRTSTVVYGPGSVFYIQARCKWNNTRYQDGLGTRAAVKMIEATTLNSTNVDQEAFIAELFSRTFPQVVGATTTQDGTHNWDDTDLGNGDFNLQPGSAFGSCLYSTKPSGCVLINPDEWITYLLKITVGNPGVFNTHAESWFARPGQTTYTKWYDKQNWIASFQNDTGYSAVGLFAYENSRPGGSANSCIIYDEPIFSPNVTIACPQYTAPTFFSSATDSAWGIIPGTATATLQSVAAAPGAFTESDQTILVTAWTGMSYDQDRKKIMGVGLGGHGDGADNSAYECSCHDASNGWIAVTTPSTSADANQVSNSDGKRGDGSRAADHNYNTPQWANDKVYLPAFGAMSGSSGFPSTAVWKWSRNDIANGRKGYTYLGLAGSQAGGSNPGLVNAGSCYDPVGRNVWMIAQECLAGQASYWSVNVDTETVTTYTPGLPFQFCPAWQFCIPDLRILLAGGDANLSNTLWRLDLTNPGAGWVSCTEGGTPRRAIGDGAVFHQNANHGGGKIYVWSGGNTLRTLTIPSAANGTYVWGSATLTGTAPSVPTNGTYKKMGLFDDMGNGQGMLVVVSSISAGVSYNKVPAGGY